MARYEQASYFTPEQFASFSAGRYESIEPLQPDQIEILTSVAKGLSTAEIASLLKKRGSTIRNKRSGILKHLGATNSTQAIFRANTRGEINLLEVTDDYQHWSRFRYLEESSLNWLHCSIKELQQTVNIVKVKN
ncbi:MAG: response regulator transcription factor [Candidatus Levybacteria bacterium]|nr:response regulator transcription factor [Candidatus Levybacteria bacterium]